METTPQQPQVAVIIPCYNCSRWITRCLAALQRQTLRGVEVICVDDCSSDQTVAAIEQFAEENKFPVTLLKNEHNMGPAASRNRAVRACRAPWVSFCDADDWYEDTYLEEMLHAVLSSGADIAMCEYKKVFESGQKSVEVHYLRALPEQASHEEMLVYSKAALWLLMVKRELLLSAEIPDLRNGEDVAYIPIMEARAGKITTVHKALYNYFINVGSASRRVSDKIYTSLLQAFEYIEANWGDSSSAALEYLGVRIVLYGVTLNAFKAGEPSKRIRGIVSQFTSKYPNWSKNAYLHCLSRPQKLHLRFLSGGHYVVCRLLSLLHQLLNR